MDGNIKCSRTHETRCHVQDTVYRQLKENDVFGQKILSALFSRFISTSKPLKIGLLPRWTA
jgi:hypothetical protein